MPLAGGQGGLLAHPEFLSSVHPIPTWGADYTHHITACPPGFRNLAASPQYVNQNEQIVPPPLTTGSPDFWTVRRLWITLLLTFQTLVEIAPFPFVEVTELREKYTFNITPWSLGIGVAKKGLRILYR